MLNIPIKILKVILTCAMLPFKKLSMIEAICLKLYINIVSQNVLNIRYLLHSYITYKSINKFFLNKKLIQSKLKKNKNKNLTLWWNNPILRLNKSSLPMGNVHYKQAVRLGAVWLDLAITKIILEFTTVNEEHSIMSITLTVVLVHFFSIPCLKYIAII